jgi:DNA-binding response OmpR family regulator
MTNDKTDKELIACSVLIADEDGYISHILASVLGAFDLGDVEEVRSFDEAVAILRQKEVNCLVVDWMDDGGSGLELVDYIRRDENSPDREMPIILLTARTELSSIYAARDHGVSEIIAKPFSASEMLKKLLAALFRGRPFIELEAYIGPDRRRRNRPWEGPERRGSYGLHQEQIDDVMREKGREDAPGEETANG